MPPTVFATSRWLPVVLIGGALLLGACSKAPESVAVAPLAQSPASAAQPEHATIDWVKPEGAGLDSIFSRARADQKPVFLYWGAVWCPPCNQIKATVFKRPDFIARSKSFIPVYLDGDTPGAQKLAATFKVSGYPTMILFLPDGTEVTRLPGEVDAVQYMRLLDLGLSANQPIQRTLEAALSERAGVRDALDAQAWRMLAYYAWDTDETQLLGQRKSAATLQRLARVCPPQQSEAADRLLLRALATALAEKAPAGSAHAALATL
ncbi:MAG: thioredoxin family protein, partial [Rhodoferax sp.]